MRMTDPIVAATYAKDRQEFIAFAHRRAAVLRGTEPIGACIIRRPDWFKREDFLALINRTQPQQAPVWSWHQPGSEPSEYSDMVVHIEASGDCTEALPDDIVAELVQILKAYHWERALVWIQNIKE